MYPSGSVAHSNGNFVLVVLVLLDTRIVMQLIQMRYSMEKKIISYKVLP